MSNRKRSAEISVEFLENCEKKFRQNPVNVIARNAINSVGVMFSTINSERWNNVSHVFTNTVKRKGVKATDQGASGRCWMFAALNTFRHLIMKALNLENFEFSETYLYFWDKLERSNTFLHWFIDHPDCTPDNRAYNYMITEYMSDGGWWNTFANLVEKYGLVPKTAMRETVQSSDSDDMNSIIERILLESVNYLRYRPEINKEEFRLQTLQKIYDTLVKFLGQPPKRFNWNWQIITEEDDNLEAITVPNLTPEKFRDITMGGYNFRNDFLVLAHIPNLEYYKNFRVNLTNNVYEGQSCILYNVPIEEMAKYARKSISKGISVWFVADVKKHFNWYTSTLDDQLDDSKLIFEPSYEFNKGDRITMRELQGNHAMALTGYNTDEKGRTISWQVENSWNYWDNLTPGLDGFLAMSQSWFEKYITQIVVNKKFLTRSFLNRYNNSSVEELNPWDSMAPAGMKIPLGYVKTHKKIN